MPHPKKNHIGKPYLSPIHTTKKSMYFCRALPQTGENSIKRYSFKKGVNWNNSSRQSKHSVKHCCLYRLDVMFQLYLSK